MPQAGNTSHLVSQALRKLNAFTVAHKLAWALRMSSMSGYPDVDNPRFQQLIAERLEFRHLYNTDGPCLHQKFVRRCMSDMSSNSLQL